MEPPERMPVVSEEKVDESFSPVSLSIPLQLSCLTSTRMSAPFGSLEKPTKLKEPLSFTLGIIKFLENAITPGCGSSFLHILFGSTSSEKPVFLSCIFNGEGIGTGPQVRLHP